VSGSVQTHQEPDRERRLSLYGSTTGGVATPSSPRLTAVPARLRDRRPSRSVT